MTKSMVPISIPLANASVDTKKSIEFCILIFNSINSPGFVSQDVTRKSSSYPIHLMLLFLNPSILFSDSPERPDSHTGLPDDALRVHVLEILGSDGRRVPGLALILYSFNG